MCLGARARTCVQVPFNDAKLTMVLRGALKGECATSVLVTCSSEDCHAPGSLRLSPSLPLSASPFLPPSPPPSSSFSLCLAIALGLSEKHMTDSAL